MRQFLLTIITIIALSSCIETFEPNHDFSGTYLVHIELDRFEVEYDSLGNIQNVGEVRYYFSDTIFITADANILDTFNLLAPVSPLYSSAFIGQSQGDTLSINTDYSTPGYVTNYKKGKFWMDGDSLRAHYSWKYHYQSGSNTFPDYGIVTASGYLME